MISPPAALTDALLVLEFLAVFQLRREPTVVTVSLRPPLLGTLSVAGFVSSSRRTTSIAFSSSTIFGCLVVSVLVKCHGQSLRLMGGIYLLAK